MPSTILGVLIFVAALGPGFVYVEIAGRRRPRQVRSPVAEGVEMAAIGATTTLLATVIVVGVADALGEVSATVLARDGIGVLSSDPWKWLAVFAGVLGLSYASAWTAAKCRYRGADDGVHEPAGAGWNKALGEQRPIGQQAVVVATLRDGTRVGGHPVAWTSQLCDSRELYLGGSLAVQPTGTAEASPLDRDFVLLRESDILYLEGHYVAIEQRQP